jgi:hypothetical protein
MDIAANLKRPIREVVWRFDRWHHLVDYSRFKNNRLMLKPGIVPVAKNNEYGMRLTRVE